MPGKSRFHSIKRFRTSNLTEHKAYKKKENTYKISHFTFYEQEYLGKAS